MARPEHLSERDLIRFADSEVQGDAADLIHRHLEICDQCRSHLQKLQRAAAAYAEYHAHVLKPSLNTSTEWQPLKFPVSKLETSRDWFGVSAAKWWAAAGLAACLLIIGFFALYEAPRQRVTDLLAKAAAVPPAPRRRLQVTLNGQSWYRPAVLRSDAALANSTAEDSVLKQTKALFVKANYSWQDPLSARSFAAWRNQLQDKSDHVVSVSSEDGNSHFYRLRTDTPQGVLRSASLTLRADTLNPVQGMFRFEDRQDVTMTDAGDMPTAPTPTTAEPPPPRRDAIETKVTPEVELRVFAALNAIGADAGEPVTVDVDPAQQHIVVSGLGISSDREQAIRQALSAIPNVTTHFGAGGRLSTPRAGVQPDTYSTGASAPLRPQLESRAGGTQAFQDIADRALDESGSLLAQAHALYVLAQRFPPAVESEFRVEDRSTLRSLRLHHAKAISDAASRLHQLLIPLLTPPADNQGTYGETHVAPQPSWQIGAGQLLESSKLLDQSLSQLLAGSYSQRAGEDMLSKLPDAIGNVQKLAEEQEKFP